MSQAEALALNSGAPLQHDTCHLAIHVHSMDGSRRLLRQVQDSLRLSLREKSNGVLLQGCTAWLVHGGGAHREQVRHPAPAAPKSL